MLGVIEAVGDPAQSPDPGAVLLSGDAGVGKSRILAELTTVATAKSWRVLTGHCLDFGDSALPYLPFSELFGRLATEHPPRRSRSRRPTPPYAG